MKLTIPKDIYEQMIAHCVADLPNEACGFLAGRDGSVDEIFVLINAAASPVYYRPDDKQMLAAMDRIDDSGKSLLVIFHSHVASPAIPSSTDIRESHYPGTVYLIVSLMDEAPQARGYLIHKQDWKDESGEIEEVELVIS